MANITNLNRIKEYMKEMIPYKEAILLNGEDKRYIVQNNDKNVVIFSIYKLNVINYRMRNEALVERADYLTQLFSSYFDSQFEFTYDYIRSYQDYDVPFKDTNYKNASKLLKHRFEKFSNTAFFSNLIFFSITYKPVNNITNKAVKLLMNEHIESFKSALQTLESSFELCGFKHELLCDLELMTYLYKSSCNNFRYTRKIDLPSYMTDINEAIVEATDFYPATVPMLINNQMIQCITLANIPLSTYPNMLSIFNNLPFAARLFIKYQTLSNDDAKKFISNKREKFKATRFKLRSSLSATLHNENVDADEIDISSIMGMQGCDNALAHKEEESLGGGFISVTIIIHANSETENLYENKDKYLHDNEKFLSDACNKIISLLSEIHILGKKETINNSYAYFSTFIGVNTCYKKFFMLADNFVDFLPISYTSSDYHSEHLQKITKSSLPFLVGLTAGTSSLYKFSLFGRYSNYGHTFLAAPTGAGKSVTLALMANEYLKYDNTQVFYIDMGLSCLKTIRDNNGRLFVPTVDDSAFAPFFHANDNDDTKMQAVNFVRSIAVANNVEMTAKDTKLILDKIEELSDPKLSFEDFFTSYAAASENEALCSALNIYISVYKNLFNATTDLFHDLPRIAGIELQGLLGTDNKSIIYPVLIYLFNRLENLFDPQHPALLILDEAWRFIDDPFFSEFIRNWLKTLRKKNVCVVISTQEINDLTKSAISHSIIENVYTRIFLRNTKAKEPLTAKTYQSLGLEDYQIQMISDMPVYYQMISQEDSLDIVSWNIDKTDLQFLDTSTSEKKEFNL